MTSIKHAFSPPMIFPISVCLLQGMRMSFFAKRATLLLNFSLPFSNLNLYKAHFSYSTWAHEHFSVCLLNLYLPNALLLLLNFSLSFSNLNNLYKAHFSSSHDFLERRRATRRLEISVAKSNLQLSQLRSQSCGLSMKKKNNMRSICTLLLSLTLYLVHFCYITLAGAIIDNCCNWHFLHQQPNLQQPEPP